MKRFHAFTLVELLIVATIVALFQVIAIPRAHAQQQPNFISVQTNWTGLANTSATLLTFTTDTNQYVTVGPRRGIAVGWAFHGTNATTSNQTLYFNLSGDGTNWTGRGGAANWSSWTVAANGTNRMYYLLTLPATNFDGVRRFAATGWTNSWTNGGIITDSLTFEWINQ